MSLDEFFVRLEAVAKVTPFKVTGFDFIRDECDRCPIEAVADVPHGHPVTAAKQLGLCQAIAGEIICAADNAMVHLSEKALRPRLLAACGLT